MAKLIKTVPQRRKSKSLYESLDHLNFMTAERRDSITVEYDVVNLLKNLVDLKDFDLSRWGREHEKSNNGENSLDELYKICSPLKIHYIKLLS